MYNQDYYSNLNLGHKIFYVKFMNFLFLKKKKQSKQLNW